MRRLFVTFLVVSAVFAGATAIAQSTSDLIIRGVNKYPGRSVDEAFVEIRNQGSYYYQAYVETNYDEPGRPCQNCTLPSFCGTIVSGWCSTQHNRFIDIVPAGASPSCTASQDCMPDSSTHPCDNAPNGAPFCGTYTSMRVTITGYKTTANASYTAVDLQACASGVYGDEYSTPCPVASLCSVDEWGPVMDEPGPIYPTSSCGY